MNEGHVDPADAATAMTRTSAAATGVLESVGHVTGPRLDVTELAARWTDIEAAMNAGHGVTLMRDGQPWATITRT